MGEPTVVAVLAEISSAHACLDAAYFASSALPGPEIMALHVHVDPFDDIMPTEEMLTREQVLEMRRKAAREGEILHGVYRTWADALRAPLRTRWVDVEGSETEMVAAIGSQAILNVIINPEVGGEGHTRNAFHACIFETHKPLLLVPRSIGRDPCDVFSSAGATRPPPSGP